MVGNLIQRANVFQSNLLYRFSFKKTLKQREYRIFLQQNTGYLPGLRTLQKGRRWCAIASILSMTPMCLGIVIYWPWACNDLVFLPLPVSGLFSPIILCGACFIILASFSVSFDHVIHKRFPSKTLLEW